MRVIVDQDLCEGNGLCEKAAPEVFRLGDDDHVQVLIERPDETLRAQVETAVRRCPRHAIRLATD
jgi:ferredoxin